MADINPNDPLGIATEGILGIKNDVFAAAVGGVAKKKFTYIGKPEDWLFGGSAEVEAIISYTAVTEELEFGSSADVEVTHDFVPTTEDWLFGGVADTQFITSGKEERGGKGGTPRKRKHIAQPHYYIYNLPHTKADTIEFGGGADYVFTKVQRFTFIKTLPKVEIVPVEISTPTTYAYTAETSNTSFSPTSEYTVYNHALTLAADDEILMLLMDDPDISYVTTMVSKDYSHGRKMDDELIYMMEMM